MSMWKFKIDNLKKYFLIISAILLFFGVVYRFLPFFQELVSPGEEIELKEARLIKYQKMVENSKGLDETLVTLNGTVKKLETGLLAGKTPSLAAAEIQKILREITDRNKVNIKTMKVLKPEEVDLKYYLSVPIEFVINADIRQLKEILYGIANSQVYLKVRKMRSLYYRGSARSFRSFITVAGFMRKENNRRGG